MATVVLTTVSKTITKLRPVVLFNRLQGRAHCSGAMDSFAKHEIVPDVVDSAPQEKLEVN